MWGVCVPVGTGSLMHLCRRVVVQTDSVVPVPVFVENCIIQACITVISMAGQPRHSMKTRGSDACTENKVVTLVLSTDQRQSGDHGL